MQNQNENAVLINLTKNQRRYLRQKQRREANRDPECNYGHGNGHGLAKRARVDLGLEIIGLSMRERTLKRRPLSCDEIAAFCGCTEAYIGQIERKAFAKLLKRFRTQLVDMRASFL